MNNDIFDKVGKQTPFTVPEGFFESMSESIGQAVERENKRHKRSIIVKWTMSAAAAIAVLACSVAALQFNTTAPAAGNSLLASYSEGSERYMTDEQLDEWIILTDNDEFINYEDNSEIFNNI